ncbi:MAG TPA: sigma factor-like helix-turn-helix DNA-binding protein, partial [Jatrophihabitantaceae bacterium]|nr:sigma factor-like helix-turn-helix DNA-binding protein [Jatrophihabitantaceae bacterium]
RSISLLSEVPRDIAGAVDLDLRAALGKLSRRQRLAIELHYYLGFPLAEVATLMDCAEGTVKSTLSDARARLRHLLGEDDR